MRVVFDMLLVEQRTEAAFLSLCALLEKLMQLDGQDEYVIVTGHPEQYSVLSQRRDIQIYPVKLQARQGVLIQHQILLPGALHHIRPHVLHVLGGIAPIGWSGPLVLSLYEASPKDFSQENTILYSYLQVMLCESARRASTILSKEESTCFACSICCSSDAVRVQVLSDRTPGEQIKEIYQSVVSETSLRNEKHVLPLREDVLPHVSVIMPVTRLAQAYKTLQTLQKQIYGGRYEVLVVGTQVEQFASQQWVQVIQVPQFCGPGRARNLGAAQAEGDLLLFIDDDILVQDDWITRHMQAHRQDGRIGLVGARIVGATNKLFARCVDYTNFGEYQSSRSRKGVVASASMSIPAALFRQLGGFDETLLSSEDIDLCYRVQQQGYQTYYQPEIVVQHDHRRTTMGEFLRYNYLHGCASGLTVKQRYPQSTMRHQLLLFIRYPPLFFLLIPCLAAGATLRIVRLNIRERPSILLYVPFILLGKCAFEFGVFVVLCKQYMYGKEKSDAERV